jgi:hypothetical protein
MARFEGSFVPTTATTDTRAALNLISLVLNTKDTGYYALEEFVNGQVWFPDPTLSSQTPQVPNYRQVFRKVFNCGPLPNAAGTLSLPHGIEITANTSFTRIYGTATFPSTRFIPLPYISSVAADIVELWADLVNINIKVAQNMSAFSKVYVVLEYIQE